MKTCRANIAIFSLLLGSIAAAAAGARNPKAATVTYTRDVAPILQKNCITCHRPGEIGPMSLLSYDQVRPWAKSIREAVVERKMPPWHAEGNSHIFENDTRLSQQEIATIVAWVDGGAQQGDPKDMPAVPTFVEGWNIGKPDVVFSMTQEYTVPAEGVIPFTYFAVPTNFKQDTWVQAAEVRPGNRAVVHHAIVLVREPRSAAPNPTRENMLDRMLVGSLPGMVAMPFKTGQGKLIKAGSILIFQVHYTPTGKEEKDRTSVGLVLAKTPVERAVITTTVANDRLKIPPGDPNYEVRALFTFPDDAWIISVMPHMHLRGKNFRYSAVYPDGRRDIILDVPRWDFRWQQIYRYKDPIFMPKGSRIECSAHFDNSAANKFNPDPTKEVYWGDQSWQEMMIGWMDFVFDKPGTTTSSAGVNR